MSNTDSPPTVRRRAPVSTDACGFARAVEEIGDRWSLLILREAFYGVVRHGDIRADLGIPRSILSDRLSRLVDCGYLEKHPYQEAGARTRYSYALTAKGRALALTFIALTQWSEDYILGGPGPVKIVDNVTGRGVRAVLIDDTGAQVDPDRAAPRPLLS